MTGRLPDCFTEKHKKNKIDPPSLVDLIDSRCLRHGLSLNPNKTGMVLFIKRRKLNDFWLPEMSGIIVQLSEKVKSLAVVLYKKFV